MDCSEAGDDPRVARNDLNGGLAVSGPVPSEDSLSTITALFGDPASGVLYAQPTRSRELPRPCTGSTWSPRTVQRSIRSEISSEVGPIRERSDFLTAPPACRWGPPERSTASPRRTTTEGFGEGRCLTGRRLSSCSLALGSRSQRTWLGELRRRVQVHDGSECGQNISPMMTIVRAVATMTRSGIK